MSKRKRNREQRLKQQNEERPFVDGDMLQRMAKLNEFKPKDGAELGYNKWGWRIHANGGASEYNPEYDTSKGRRGLRESGVTRFGGGSGSSAGSSGTHRYTGDTFYTSGPGVKDEHVFTCKSTELEGKCPLPHKTPDIYINARVWDQWCHMCNEVPKEWIAYFRTEELESGDYELRMFYFPAQTATATSVDVPTGVVPQHGVNGAVHSHVKMAAFWSSTDTAHSNWPTEIVMNNKGEYKALVRVKLACGSYIKEQATVHLKGSSVELDYLNKLNRAYAKGAQMEKVGSGAKENEEPEPVNAAQAQVAQVAQDQVAPTQALVKNEQKVEPQEQQQTPEQVRGICPDCHHPNGWHKLVNGYCDADGCYCKRGRMELVGAQAKEANVLAAAVLALGVGTLEELDALDDLDDSAGEECTECEGVGMVDISGDTEFCTKCNGWGRLLDGQPLSAEGPNSR